MVDGVPDGVRELFVRGSVPAGEPGAAAGGQRGGEGARRGGRTQVHRHWGTGKKMNSREGWPNWMALVACVRGHPFVTSAKFLILDPSSPLCPHFTQPIKTVRLQNQSIV